MRSGIFLGIVSDFDVYGLVVPLSLLDRMAGCACAIGVGVWGTIH